MVIWQEGTNDLHDMLANTKIERMGLNMGRELFNRERVNVLSDYRKMLSG